MYVRKNLRENAIINKYVEKGYSFITKGYPDVCFYKDDHLFFVEIKRKQKITEKMGLSAHQKKMHELLRRLGAEVKVEYI